MSDTDMLVRNSFLLNLTYLKDNTDSLAKSLF